MDVGKYWQAETVYNGTSLNGISLNGEGPNGISLNGISLNGISLNGISLNGISLNGISLNGTDLSGTLSSDSSLLSGSDLIGADMSGSLSNGLSLPLRITGRDDTSSVGVKLWYVSIVDNSHSPATLVPICNVDSHGDPIPAIPLQGVWNNATGAYSTSSTLFTFACVNAAIGKCTLWGYKPWASATETLDATTSQSQSLQAWHQACTRMVRADYCGDGQPHTYNGTPINLWDALSIQTKDTDASFTSEAEWTQSGARCIDRTRWAAANSDWQNLGGDLAYVQYNCPQRLTLSGTSCSVNADCETGFECVSGACKNSDCLDPSASDFLTANGYYSPLSGRRLLRNETGPNDLY